PMYVLPDEFLVSGESLIRNLLIGHQLSRKFGRVMKAAYIPDPFGHIAQLPQVIKGFEIPSVLFWRGFGNKFEENNLNIEFIWNSPGQAASVLGIHLLFGYGLLEKLNTKKIKGEYKPALRKIKDMVKKFENYIGTPNVLLNNGSDHDEAQPEIPEIIKQWNKLYPEKLIEQGDFEYYVNKVLDSNPKLKNFEGELRGGKYAHILSGVFSTRMWIKQRNSKIEYLYEKYSEPISTITWALDKYDKFVYPKEYILTGLIWLQKNAPHDSICGCSIDQVHDEMKIRFDWAEQIANEIFKNSILYLTDLINIETKNNGEYVLIVYNPLPWQRKGIVAFDIISQNNKGEKLPYKILISDFKGDKIPYQQHFIEEKARFTREQEMSHRFTFLAEIPACGYKVYYIFSGKSISNFPNETDNFKISSNFLENEFYRINITSGGSINVFDKQTGISYDNVCEFEDVGDWGDEYDFSGPYDNQTDLKFTTEDATFYEREIYIDGPTQKTYKLSLNLKLPRSFSEDRYNRSDWLVDNEITIYISLYKGIKRIDFSIELENNSKDHRIRALFPTKIKAEKVHADGHFYVVPRMLKMPEAEKWVQKPLPTNHQKDFVSISDDFKTFAILNKGLPEYEAIVNQDGTITFAITLLRCIEWLSRNDFITRKSHAGPAFKTPGAQCIDKYKFELAITTESKSSWLDSEIHTRGKEFNNPLNPIFPNMVQTPIRFSDKLNLRQSGIISYFLKPKNRLKQSYLPQSLSFLKIDNKSVVLSAIKKSEENNFLIVRVYNISPFAQKGSLTFYDKIIIKDVQIVNFLEEIPQHEIKSKIKDFNKNKLEVLIEPHVIVTFKLEYELLL
ncbi:MAG: glycoside hydrolase family 38 C-terminal domain-containing protein, partial [Promethearchaeota archaeon]